MRGRERLPARRFCETFEVVARRRAYTATVGFYADARPGEIFLSTGKSGTDVEIATKDAAVLASIALQYGAPVEVLRRALMRDEQGRAEGPVGALLDLLAEGCGE